MEQFKGKVWVLGDDIDTDIIIPTEYLALPTVEDMKQYDNCGECEFCKKGLTSECVTLGAGRNKLSPDGYHGGFGCSEYVIKPYRSL